MSLSQIYPVKSNAAPKVAKAPSRYYTCTGYRPIRHDGDTVRSIDDAARIFASRIAREKYGSTGYVASIRQDTSPRDLRYANYEAYIGRSVASGGGEGKKTSGRQIWLVVGVRNYQPGI